MHTSARAWLGQRGGPPAEIQFRLQGCGGRVSIPVTYLCKRNVLTATPTHGMRTTPHLWMQHHVHGTLWLHHVGANLMVHLLRYRSVSHHRNPTELFIPRNGNDLGSDQVFARFFSLNDFFLGWLPEDFNSEIEFDGDRTRNQGHVQPVLSSLGHIPFPSHDDKEY
jgi:hypothetical protein